MLKMTNFTNTTQQFSDLIDKNYEVANTLIENYKQFLIMQCNSAREMIAEASTITKNLGTFSSPTEAYASLQSSMNKFITNSYAKSKEIMSIAHNTKSLFGDVTTSTIKDLQESIVKSTENFAQVNPDLAKMASTTINTIIDKSNSVVDTVSTLSTEFANTASKQIEKTTDAVIKKVATITSVE